MANAREIVHCCEYGGVELRLQDGRILARMIDGQPIPAGAQAFVQRFRENIIAELECRQEPTPEEADAA